MKFRGRIRSLAAAAIVAAVCCISVRAFSVPASSLDEINKLRKEAAKLVRAGDLAGAEDVLRRALAQNASRSDVKLDLASVLTKERNLLEAFDLAFSVVRDEPKNSHALAVFGMTLMTGGRFEDARRMFIASLRKNKKEHLAWGGIGLLDFYENRIDNSLNNLREAVYYDPNEPDYVFALAQVAARSEHYTEAADNYTEFLRVSSIKDKDRRERIKGLINFLKYLGNAEAIYRLGGGDQAKVPFELVGDRPVITLNVNGTPLKFVLDTGSGISVISYDAGKKLKIKPVARGGWAKGIGGDGKFEIVYGFLRDIGIGSVSVRNVPVYIRTFHKDNRNVDGYIGLALISKFLATIDYGEQTFALTKKTADAVAAIQKSDLALPLRLTSSGFLSGEVRLEGIDLPLNFIVDTGASVSVISSSVAKESGISQFIKDEKLKVIGSAGETDNVPTFMLPKVSFGKNSRRDIKAIALDLGIINEASGFEQSGILGGNFLKNYRLTFDFKNSIVTFVDVRPEKE